MDAIAFLATLLEYNDWANDVLLAAAEPVGEAQMDAPFDIGPGSLRKILAHIETGEYVWLRRQRGEHDAPWSSAVAPGLEGTGVAALRLRFAHTRGERAAFLRGLTPDRLSVVQPYRDSRGTTYRASLRDMLTQGFVHSTHHRAQAVNVLRRLGLAGVELDYMYHQRMPA